MLDRPFPLGGRSHQRHTDSIDGPGYLPRCTELAVTQGRLERHLPLRYHSGRIGPGLLFQRVVQRAHLPLGKRRCNKTLLPFVRIRPSLRSRSRSWLRPHLHDPRRQRQGAGGGMPAGAGHGHRAVPHRRPARHGRGAETSLVYRRLAAGAGKW